MRGFLTREDTVEFGEWKTEIRVDGATLGFVSFVQKASLGFAAGLLGEVLSVIGYTANMAQTPETLAGLKIIMLAVPALFASLATVMILFYSLDTNLHGRLVRALRWRRVRRNTAGSRLVCGGGQIWGGTPSAMWNVSARTELHGLRTSCSTHVSPSIQLGHKRA